MKKKTVILLLVLFILIAGGATYFIVKNKKTKKTEWLTEKPQKKDIRILVTATGPVNAVQSVQVGTQVSGVISKIWVDYNDIVHKDQPIAQLDIANLKATLDEAQANLAKAQALYQQTKSEYDRNAFLLDKKVIPKADYDLSLSNYLAAKTAISAAVAEVKKAQTNLRYATIKAPINGVIVSRDVDVGQTVAASFATPRLFVIANDLKKMQLQANVDEADIGQVKIGQQAMFKVDAFPDEMFSGVVQQIRLQPNVQQNVVNYSVMIDAPNPDLKLMPGMNADISIIVQEKKDVLAVPVAATKFIPPINNNKDTSKHKQWKEGSHVYVLENNRPREIGIQTGLSDGVYAEVLSTNISPETDLVTGIKTRDATVQSAGLLQHPRSTTGSTMRNMR